MTRSSLPEKDAFKGETIGDYRIEGEIGRGNIGVVYRACHKEVEDIEVAIKFITEDSLKTGWEQELVKVGKLSGIPQVVQYKSTPLKVTLNGVRYVLLFWEYIEGINLREYIKNNDVDISFIEHFIAEIFDAFTAMAATDITHGDLHEGNILIKPKDDRLPDPTRPVIKVTDFGIGGSHNFLEPKDDYNQLSVICERLLESIDPATLNGGDKFFYDRLTEEFIPKKVLEKNPTTGDFVRNPRTLKMLLKEIRNSYADRSAEQIRQLPLENPFDYLSCEEMGDKFGVLQTLYSEKFPGYNDLLQRTNTILTGPRGCGKTTILRTLSLKTRLLGGKITSVDQLEDYIGIYYHSNDLYFAFPYLKEKITDDQRRIIGSFFSLSVFYELIETLRISQKYLGELQKVCNLGPLEDYLKQCIPAYEKAFYSQSVLDHLGAFIIKQKDLIRIWSTRGDKTSRPTISLPLDFIKTVCRICIDCVPWLKGRVIYFFLDDYSLPRISKPVQETLNDFILIRYSECFFKISTESIVTFYPYDSHGKLLERSREYDVIDLGDYFLNAEESIKGEFLLGVINNRLKNTKDIATQYKDISALLGVSGRSFNQLARDIRGNQRVYYHGWDTVVNLCSGDVVNILILIRDVISLIGGPKMLTTYNESDGPKVALDKQDKAIRELGNDFLNRIEAVPSVGKELRKIAEAFGNLAHWYLKNVDSKNEDTKPAHQAFRLEMLETLVFSEEIKEKLKREYNKELSVDMPKIEELYRELIRYGVFIRDVRGKSQRGSVVPRLYLRRLLIPTFLLTPNKRDHIRVEVEEFYWLLGDPDSFYEHMIDKKKNKKRKKIDTASQGKLL
ncbi:MAG: protein kinase [Desulfitobacterium hafniense]|nr:protein kinase [Desulfitobacterium hafniense]